VKILMLTKYDTLGASSRMRMLQYIPSIELAGHDVIVSPLFSNQYIVELQNKKRRFISIIFSYFKRIKLLLLCKNFDLIWIEKECFPWIPAILEKLFLPKKIPYALDFDDAVFHIYDKHHFFLAKMLLKNKHQKLIHNSKLVTVGNEYLFQYVSRVNRHKAFIIPTAIDINHYKLETIQHHNRCDSKICFGWIGQRSTAYNLYPFANLFQELLLSENILFTAIGIDARSLNLPMKSIKWSYETEVLSLQTFDVGIMPLTEGIFENGKCGYKLIQYMASGLPVIASPVGVNRKIVKHGINGFLANTEDEWRQSINALMNDENLRYEMGLNGRKLIEEEYCTNITAPEIIKLLEHTQGG